VCLGFVVLPAVSPPSSYLLFWDGRSVIVLWCVCRSCCSCVASIDLSLDRAMSMSGRSSSCECVLSPELRRRPIFEHID
jgi:hypothetical protein